MFFKMLIPLFGTVEIIVGNIENIKTSVNKATWKAPVAQPHKKKFLFGLGNRFWIDPVRLPKVAIV